MAMPIISKKRRLGGVEQDFGRGIYNSGGGRTPNGLQLRHHSSQMMQA